MLHASPQTSPKKPSPLSYNNSSNPSTPQRASPFKRQNSSASISGRPAPAGSRAETQSPSPAPPSPSSTVRASSPLSNSPRWPPREAIWSSNGGATPPTGSEGARNGSPVGRASKESPAAPAARALGSSGRTGAAWNTSSTSPGTHGTPVSDSKMSSGTGGSDPLAKLPPALLREMRESFQTLDRDNDGTVNDDDVADMLGQLGQDPNPATLRCFFESSTQSSINLSTYLNTLARLTLPASSSHELTAAFSAFDLDDSGQVDVRELKEAMLRTSSAGEHEAGFGAGLTEREIDTVIGEFAGRRAFGIGGGLGRMEKRGDVFRYKDFVGAVGGNAGAESKGGGGDAEGFTA